MRCSPCHSRRSFLVILYLDLYLGMYFIVLRGASRPLVAATDFLRFKLDFSFHYSPGGKVGGRLSRNNSKVLERQIAMGITFQ